MSKKEGTPSENLIKYLGVYLQPSTSRGNTIDELEARFGTRKGKPITQIQFDSVIAKLKSLGFEVLQKKVVQSLKLNSTCLHLQSK